MVRRVRVVLLLTAVLAGVLTGCASVGDIYLEDRTPVGTPRAERQVPLPGGTGPCGQTDR